MEDRTGGAGVTGNDAVSNPMAVSASSRTTIKPTPVAPYQGSGICSR